MANSSAALAPIISDALEAADIIVDAEMNGKISHCDDSRIRRMDITDLESYKITKAMDWLAAHRSMLRQRKAPKCEHGVNTRISFGCVECQI